MEKLYEENWYQKRQKKHFWAKFLRLYRYTPQQKPNGTGTDPSCTGTAQQNAIGTGTYPSCTGTGVPKMPKLL